MKKTGFYIGVAFAAAIGIPATHGYNNKEACVRHMNNAITDPKPASLMSTAKTVGSVPFRAGCWLNGSIPSRLLGK